MHTITDIVQSRHATKAFDPTRKLSAEQVTQIETLLRFSPSSINSQPWHYVIASSEEGKARLAKAAEGPYSANIPKIHHASHVVLFCTRASIQDDYLATLLDQETIDGRLRNDESRANAQRARAFYVDMHRFERRDAQHWMEKQVYLAVGTLLLGAGMMQIDACPIEGFDQITMDTELGLRAQGLTSSLMIALGYRSEEDFNAALPKSRLPAERIITRL